MEGTAVTLVYVAAEVQQNTAMWISVDLGFI